ncbi:MAG TPA: hypothetical protein EYH50_02050 [Pyrodictium delaneyi]|uniref:Uncharacterized protein n=1 Tax=Pyrodictium delaneyi TaxID=1273541 RepID=A0A832ZTA8_9CREN|nr:hypothetical protein [Pyrodictium delaneyi]
MCDVEDLSSSPCAYRYTAICGLIPTCSYGFEYCVESPGVGVVLLVEDFPYERFREFPAREDFALDAPAYEYRFLVEDKVPDEALSFVAPVYGEEFYQRYEAYLSY